MEQRQASLFDDIAPHGTAQATDAALTAAGYAKRATSSSRNTEGTKSSVRKQKPRRGKKQSESDHLIAAQKLARHMRKHRRPRSVRRIQGLVICRHLIAHLREHQDQEQSSHS